MSFILDALKKSDAERQKRSTPGFADIPESRDRGRPPKWLWLLGGLLVVNLLAVTALVLRPDDRPVASLPTPGVGDASAPPQAREPGKESRSFSDIVAEAREARPEKTAPEGRMPGSTEPATASPRREPQARAEPVAEQAAPALPVPEATATFDSLRANGTLRLPDLHLDIHVYSDKPSDRFVFINMKKYKENETLSEGPTVRHIAPEGVVLEQGGNVFLLPRQ